MFSNREGRASLIRRREFFQIFPSGDYIFYKQTMGTPENLPSDKDDPDKDEFLKILFC
jgi:hypothetical protein